MIEDTSLFDELSCDKQREILDETFLLDAPNDVVDMQDNESLYDVITLIHKAWQQKYGVSKEEYDAIDLCDRIIRAWDEALRHTLAVAANDELKYREQAALHKFNEDE